MPPKKVRLGSDVLALDISLGLDLPKDRPIDRPTIVGALEGGCAAPASGRASAAGGLLST